MVPLVYHEPRRLAASYLRRERANDPPASGRGLARA